MGRGSKGRKYESKVDGGYRPTFFTSSKMLSEIPLGSPTHFYFIPSNHPHPPSPSPPMLFFFSLFLLLVLEPVRDGTYAHTCAHPRAFPHTPVYMTLLSPEEEFKKKKNSVPGEKRSTRKGGGVRARVGDGGGQETFSAD